MQLSGSRWFQSLGTPLCGEKLVDESFAGGTSGNCRGRVVHEG